jgi:hypothetical protein
MVKKYSLPKVHKTQLGLSAKTGLPNYQVQIFVKYLNFYEWLVGICFHVWVISSCTSSIQYNWQGFAAKEHMRVIFSNIFFGLVFGTGT